MKTIALGIAFFPLVACGFNLSAAAHVIRLDRAGGDWRSEYLPIGKPEPLAGAGIDRTSGPEAKTDSSFAYFAEHAAVRRFSKSPFDKPRSIPLPSPPRREAGTIHIPS